MKNITQILLLLCAAFLAACSNDKEETTLENLEPSLSSDIMFSATITTRATDTAFESGDEISVTAYNTDSSTYAENISYSYSDSSFSSSSPIKYSGTDHQLAFRAIYPYVEMDDNKSATFRVESDQSSGSNYTLSDLMSSYVDYTSSTSPQLIFSHLLTKVVLNITSTDVEMINVVASVNASAGVEYNFGTLTSTTQDSPENITMASNGVNSYKVIIAPQTISSSNSFGSIEINGSNYSFGYTTDVNMAAGKEYTIDAAILNGEIIFENPIINDWDKGEITDGYIAIYTSEEFAKIGVDDQYPLDGDYILMNDITLSSDWTPIGGVDYNSNVLLNVTNSYPFTGSFDGGNNTISGLNVSSNKTHLGLFGFIDGATIKNLTLNSPSVNIIKDSPYTTNIGYNGCLVGYATGSVIQGCGVIEGSVSGYVNTGGVVGYITSATEVVSCYFNGESTSYGAYGGGIAACAVDYSKIIACYNTGTVNNSSYMGGITGVCNNSVITSCYNTGEIAYQYSSTCKGAIAGWVLGGDSAISYCYYMNLWDTDSTGQFFAGTSTNISTFSIGDESTIVSAMNSAISGAGYTDIKYTTGAYGYGPSLMDESFAYPTNTY